MTYKRMLQAAMAAGLSAAIGLGATACSRDYVADYVYTVSSSGPNINAFAVDFQSGILTQVTGSPFQTGFKRETTLVPSPDGKFIYVLSGFEDSAVEVFAVGTDGKLYGQKTYNLSGTYPTAMAIDAAVVAIVMVVAAGMWMSVWWPARGPADRIAGTYLVPE